MAVLAVLTVSIFLLIKSPDYNTFWYYWMQNYPYK